jgi:hypothetical protein
MPNCMPAHLGFFQSQVNVRRAVMETKEQIEGSEDMRHYSRIGITSFDFHSAVIFNG